jgi:glutathione-dependent formaldehyde-activating enzyme
MGAEELARGRRLGSNVAIREAAAMSTQTIRAHGGCLCGGVRYEVTAPFLRANFCHCSRCRKHTGAAASAQGRVPHEAFRLLAGDELVNVYRPPEGGIEPVRRLVARRPRGLDPPGDAR